MAAILGAVVGYIFGTRDGKEGWEEIRSAWKVISTSDEVRDLVGGGISMARDILGRGGEGISERMSGSNSDPSLRRVA